MTLAISCGSPTRPRGEGRRHSLCRLAVPAAGAGLHVGPDHAGMDGVAADVPLAQLRAQGFGHQANAAFGGGIGRAIGQADQAGDRRPVHDRAAAASDHCGRRASAAQEHAGQVDIDLAVPVGERQLGQGLPYVRVHLNARLAKCYAPLLPRGGIIPGEAVPQVVRSRASGFKEGDFVAGFSGWQDYSAPPPPTGCARSIRPWGRCRPTSAPWVCRA